MKWLKRLLGLTPTESLPVDERESTVGDAHILKLRFYSENKWTLNGVTRELIELPEIARTASSNGGCLWVWSEDDITEANQDVLRRLIKDVNMMLAFSETENFEGLPLPQDADFSSLSNVYIYNDQKELEEFAANENEFFIYLKNLQLIFDTYIATREKPAKADDGIFNIVGAVRPHASRFWLLHPGVCDDEFYRPLRKSLESQPLPCLNGGLLAFLISNKVPAAPDESIEFEVVVPEEWLEAAKSAEKDMSVTEIIDTIWPASAG